MTKLFRPTTKKIIIISLTHAIGYYETHATYYEKNVIADTEVV